MRPIIDTSEIVELAADAQTLHNLAYVMRACRAFSKAVQYQREAHVAYALVRVHRDMALGNEPDEYDMKVIGLESENEN